MTPDAAALFARELSTYALAGTVRASFAREMADSLAHDGHRDAAEMVRMAADEADRRRLSAVLPGGAR